MIRARQKKKLWIAKLLTSQKNTTADTEMSENLMVREPRCLFMRYNKLTISCTGSREDAVILGIPLDDRHQERFRHIDI